MKFTDWVNSLNWETVGWSGITILVPIKNKEIEKLNSIEELELSDDEKIIFDNSEKADCEIELYENYGIDVEAEEQEDGNEYAVIHKFQNFDYVKDTCGFIYFILH